MKQTHQTTMDKGNEHLPGLRILQNECIWMRAGVVNFKVCDCNYDCFSCDFDRRMRHAMDAQRPPRGKAAEKGWAAKMRETYLGREKPCRYLLTGEIEPPGLCTRDYDCDGCPIHMAMEYEPVSRSVEAERYSGELRAGLDPSAEPARVRPLTAECIWMQAGIINFKLCDGEYDCYHCAFDQNMREAMGAHPGLGKSRNAQWQLFMGQRYDTAAPPCIHRLSGDLDAPDICTEGQSCYHCPHHLKHAARTRVEMTENPAPVQGYGYASGFKMAEGYYYHFGHAWVRLEADGLVRTGVDDFASRVFGPARAVQLPPKGVHLTQGKTAWAMVRNGKSAAVQAPLSGKVVSVNPRVLEDPRACHEDPYVNGWVMLVEPSSLRLDLNTLYYGEESRRWMESETRSLHELMGPQYEELAATGAQPVDDLYGTIPGLNWDDLTQKLLRTTAHHPEDVVNSQSD